MPDMTVTEKDAMALALLDAEIASCGRLEPEDCENCGRIREARAHLAARLAELEAELAAVRELLERGRRVPLCGDMPEAIVFVNEDARALEVARGAG